jgi:outer membrane protein insertion porin family
MSGRAAKGRLRVRRPFTLLALPALLSALGVPGDAGADAARVPVFVVWTSGAAPGAAASGGAARLAAFASALEADGRVQIRGQQVADSALLSREGPSAEQSAPRTALEAGARVVVYASLTTLGPDHSLDLRAVEAEDGTVIFHRVLEAAGPDDLSRAIAEGGSAAAAALAAPQATAQASPDEAVDAGALPAPDVAAADVPLGDRPFVDGGIAEVRIEGNRRIEADAIRAVLSTRAGEPLDRGRVSADVRRIYELSYFRDVRVVRSEEPGGTVVTFHVEENPIIRQVSVSGNDNVGSDELKEVLTLTAGNTIRYPLVLENQQRLEALYQSRGFYLARVSYTVEPLAEGAVSVNFDVDEGEKLRLVEIDFEGNEHFSDDELCKGFQTKPWTWYSFASHYFDKSGLYAEPIFLQDLNSVGRKYMDAGYIRVRVGDPDVKREEDGLRVVVPVTEGAQYTVGELAVAGDDVDPEELRELVELAPGDVFSRSRLSADVERLESHYTDQGFYFAKVTPDTDVDAKALTVDTTFRVEKGDLVFLDRIEVRGNTRTRDEVVRRELSVAEGSLYSADALARSKARVQRLGFFEEVAFEPRPHDDPQRVALDVEVVERSTGSFSAGAGFGSSDGFLVNGSVRQDNLLGRGWGLQASVDLGSINQAAFLRFTNPYALGTRLSAQSTLSMTDREYQDFSQEVRGIDFTLGYPLDEGETRGFGSYQFSNREVQDFEAQAASLIQREFFQGESSTSLLSFSARRDTRDDIRFPRDGQVTGFALEWAGLGGWSNFLRLEGRSTWWFPLKSLLGQDWTFMVNSRAGYVFPLNAIGDFDLPGCTDRPSTTVIEVPGQSCADFVADPLKLGQAAALAGIDDDLELPLSERYFLGGLGAFPVRGFESRSLGPRRAILVPTYFGNGDVAFSPSGYVKATAGSEVDCAASGGCNELDDSDIDDFDNLDLTDVIGGNKMMLVNFELLIPISEDLGLTGIVFFDAGNAFAENESINPADFRLGTGVGAQWFSPFGPIVVYLGFPLDRLEDEDASVFEFSFGGGAY